MRTRANSAHLIIVSVLLSLVIPVPEGMAETVWFYGGSFDLTIPADPEKTRGWMDDAIVEVPDHFIIEDLDVSVSLAHTNVFDLRLSLTSPSGTTVLLNSYDPFTDYFEGQDYQQTVFDDEAVASIVDGRPPFEGRYRPVGDDVLSAFDGEDAFGSWRLGIYDAHYVDTGSLTAFGLAITAPEPATAVILLLGLGIAGLSKPRNS